MEMMCELYRENGEVLGVVIVVGKDLEDCQRQIDTYVKRLNYMEVIIDHCFSEYEEDE